MARHIPAEPLLSLNILLKACLAGNGEFGGGVRLYSHARCGILQWALETGSLDAAIYVPSYICADAVEPLEHLGQRVRFYPILDTLEPDWNWLNAHMDDQAKGFLLVHYFGFPNAVEGALEFCRQRGLPLLEDCAHSFLSRHRDQAIGSFGDAGFYSFHKMLPVPTGAGMIGGGNGNGPSHSISPASSPYRELLRRLAEYALHRAAIPSRLWSWLRGGYSKVGRSSGPLEVSPMPRISRRIIKALEPEFGVIVAKRRENYSRLAEAFRSFPEVRPLYPELPEGVCPYTFPVLVSGRDGLVQELQARGVPAQGWPTLPWAVAQDPEFEVANRYGAELMMLPVHQNLGPRDMERIIEAYQTVARAVGTKT